MAPLHSKSMSMSMSMSRRVEVSNEALLKSLASWLALFHQWNSQNLFNHVRALVRTSPDKRQPLMPHENTNNRCCQHKNRLVY